MAVVVPRELYVGFHPDHDGVSIVINGGKADELIIPLTLKEACDTAVSLKERAERLAAMVDRGPREYWNRLDS
jgi:hypothetical protein